MEAYNTILSQKKIDYILKWFLATFAGYVNLYLIKYNFFLQKKLFAK